MLGVTNTGNMVKDYGVRIPYDPMFNGPIRNRSSTDFLFLILFLLFLGVWGWVGIYSMNNGDVDKLLAPIDSNGKRCGVDNEVKNKKYLVFFDIAKCLLPQSGRLTTVCVNRCPDKTIKFSTSKDLGDLSSMVCTYDIDVQTLTFIEAMEQIRNGKCASYVIKSQPVVGRCFANVNEAFKISQIANLGLNEKDVLAKMAENIKFQQQPIQLVQDLVQSRWCMFGALLAVVIICFAYILLLRWVVAYVVWTSIVCFYALLCYLLHLCNINYEYFKINPKGPNSVWGTHQIWLAILIIGGIFMALLPIVICCLIVRINKAIALIKEGGNAIYAIKSTIFFPLLPWMLQCSTIAYGVTVLLHLMSIGEPTFKIVVMDWTECFCSSFIKELNSCDPAVIQKMCLGACQNTACQLTGITTPGFVVFMHIMNLFGFVWTMFFISGVSDMMLAGTFASWYWTFRKTDLSYSTLTSSIYRTVRFHLGTVALGTLIITIVHVIRVLSKLAIKKDRTRNLFELIIRLIAYLLGKLESVLKFINKNAFIMCAVHGKNFCSSAVGAFSLLMRNIVQVVVLDKVMDFMFFLSKMLISVGVGISVYYILQESFMYEVTQGESLHSHYIPAIIVSVATYMICTVFFSVYAIAVDTLFLCFLEDCERNDGSPDKPYFMTKNLMKIFTKEKEENVVSDN